MQIKHLSANDTKTTNWNQGKTAEYYIYPESCDYANKDFLFRVSSATIDEQPARFTIFIGYTRYLAMLNNQLAISINRNKTIKDKYEIIKFKSEDDTIAYATGKDFNLMIKEDIKEHDVIYDSGFFTYDNSFVIVYATKNCEVFVQNESYQMQENDCLIIENSAKKSFELITPTKVIIAYLNLVHDGAF